MGSFADTLANNLNNLNLGKLLADTAGDFGWSIGEDVFTYFSGLAGLALKTIFRSGKVENVVLQQNDINKSAGSGAIRIQNQGGVFRSCQQITIRSNDPFDEDVALNVFTVSLDIQALEILKETSPELYQYICENTTYTYNISLLKDHKEVQPSSPITVYIPIPEELTLLAWAGKVQVFRMEEDGTVTKMDATVQDGFLVFETNHLSLYTIAGELVLPPLMHGFVYGDANHDGRVNVSDAVAVMKHRAGALSEKDTFCDRCANVDTNPKINVSDAVLIMKKRANKDMRFPIELQ